VGWPGLLFGVLRHPVVLLFAAVGLAWALISVNSQGHQGPPQKPDVPIVARASLTVIDGEGGAVVIQHLESMEPLATYAAGEGSFVRGVMRTLVRERVSRSIESEPIFVLELTAAGGLILLDELTGYWIAIEAFGPDNYREFRALFDLAQALDVPALEQS
jgi:putative photosynthetic complex assembly protein